MKLRWKLHSQRSKHQTNMNIALGQVDHSERLKQRMAKNDYINAWHCIEAAIGAVVDCGCPRDMWPARVQETIPAS